MKITKQNIFFIIKLHFSQWRYGVILLFIWLFIGDSIRKIFPRQPAYFILMADAIILVVYFYFFIDCLIKKRRIWLPSFWIFLGLFVCLVIANTFNPFLPTVAMGLIGARSYLWFIPLMWIAYSYFNNINSIVNFTKKLVYMAIPLFLFAIVQLVFFNNLHSAFFLPLEGSHRVHAFGLYNANAPSIPKIPSFFGNDQRYGMISMGLFFLGLGLLSNFQFSLNIFWRNLLKNKIKILLDNNLLFLSTISAFGGIIISGSNSAFILAFLGLIVFLAVKWIKQWFIYKKKIIIIRVLFKLIFLIFIIMSSLFIMYKIGVMAGLSDILSFKRAFVSNIPQFFTDMKILLSDAKFFGHGTGLVSQGLEQIGMNGFIEKFGYNNAGETGANRLIVELGILGFIIFIFLYIGILTAMFREIYQMGDSSEFFINLSILIFTISILIRFFTIHHQVFGDWTILILFWFFIGIFFKLANIINNK